MECILTILAKASRVATKNADTAVIVCIEPNQWGWTDNSDAGEGKNLSLDNVLYYYNTVLAHCNSVTSIDDLV